MSSPHMQIHEVLETGQVDDRLTFHEPWMARAFGLTLALSEKGTFSLKDFQEGLIKAIQNKEKASRISDEESYYECWMEALIVLLKERNLIFDERIVEIEKFLVEEAAARRDHQHHHVQRNADGTPHIAPITLEKGL